MKKTPGNKISNGASAKNNHPKINDIGMPKYSKGAKREGSTIRYEITKLKTPIPPNNPNFSLSS
tara:strand:+ start:601 stop:792 length:192 start_codon:yes stop_codon:yes gene_type:complete